MSIDELYKANYDQLIDKISADLKRWAVLPLTLSGRIESIKRWAVLPLTLSGRIESIKRWAVLPLPLRYREY